MTDLSLSIVIPAYNMEKYLDRCLASLIVKKERMSLFEALVINDGSKDRTAEIGYSYEEKYPGTFRVINKENGHYGSCINRGLAEARGKYIKVLDSDDFFDSSFEDYLLFLKTVDVDVVLTDFVYDFNGRIIKKRGFDYEPEKVMGIESFADKVSVMHHATITYRSEMLRKISYDQTEGISYTDLEWSTIPFSAVGSFIYYPRVIYHYLIGRNGQSIDIEYRKNNMWMMNTVLLGISDRYESTKKEMDSPNRITVKSILSGSVSHVYYHYILNYPRQLKESELKTFDQDLLKTSEEIYQAVEDSVDKRKFGTFFFIKDFREKGSRNWLKYYFYDICISIGALLRKLVGKNR